jgi:hypothetical protein
MWTSASTASCVGEQILLLDGLSADALGCELRVLGVTLDPDALTTERPGSDQGRA